MLDSLSDDFDKKKLSQGYDMLVPKVRAGDLGRDYCENSEGSQESRLLWELAQSRTSI